MATMEAAPLRIDFVSDITCPWCAIGLRTLEQAIARIGDTVSFELHLQPFELNPGIPAEGEPIAAYAARKSGANAEQLAERQALIRRRAAEVGLDFPARTHVYNTFDAHRLLHWATLHGRQLELKHALLRAYHERSENPSSPEVLLAAAVEAGLDRCAAGDVLGRDTYADAVRVTVRQWQRLGIDGVPSIIIDGRHLIQGGQAAAELERALLEIAAGRVNT
jgi:predicted DsbA family dithiol-disulfide isomerase